MMNSSMSGASVGVTFIHSRAGLVMGEGDMPRSMRAGCPVWVIDLDGDRLNSAVDGPIAGSCSLNGCSSCDGHGSWL